MKKASKQPKHFFQIRGIPGSGKTTVAKVIKSLSPVSVFEVATDQFWDEDEEFDPERAEEAHEWCREQVEKATRKAIRVVIVHNTAAEYWEMENYQQIAEDSGYVYHRIIVEDHHGCGSTKDEVDEKIRDYMERKFQTRIKTDSYMDHD